MGPAATGIFIHVDVLNPGLGDIVVTGPAWTCTNPGTAHISCSSSSGQNLAISESMTLPFTVRVPNGAGRIALRAGVGWSWAGEIGNPMHRYAPLDISGVVFRRFTVTNENDSDAGSLRAALTGATHDPVCATSPCAIDFADDVARIAPLSPLPALSGGGIPGYAHGLDGPRVANGNVPPPILLSATYDPATNATTITGQGTPPSGGGYQRFMASFYANEPADPEGEQFLAATFPDDVTGRIVMQVPGNLRGKWITAVTTRITNLDGSLLYDTSEFSDAVEVR